MLIGLELHITVCLDQVRTFVKQDTHLLLQAAGPLQQLDSTCKLLWACLIASFTSVTHMIISLLWVSWTSLWLCMKVGQLLRLLCQGCSQLLCSLWKLLC